MLQEGVNAYIYPGNRYNDPISDFNEEDLEFMKLLSKPTTKHDVMCKIYEAMTEESISPLALQQSNKYTMILAFYEEMIRRYGILWNSWKWTKHNLANPRQSKVYYMILSCY